MGFLPLPGYIHRVGQDIAENRELVALTFRSLEEALAKGGREEAVSAIREAFAGRIRACLIDLPSAEEMKELPEALQQEIRERQRKAARLQQKREAALQVIPAYSQLLEAYRSYDAEMGSPRRLARTLRISARRFWSARCSGISSSEESASRTPRRVASAWASSPSS